MGFELPKRSDKEVTIFSDHFIGTRILLAEENVANQVVASEILSSVGFVVEVAENGKVTVEMCLKSVELLNVLKKWIPEEKLDRSEVSSEIRKPETLQRQDRLTEPLEPERPPVSLAGIDVDKALRRLGVTWKSFKKRILSVIQCCID